MTHNIQTNTHTRTYVHTFITYVQYIYTFYALHTHIHTHTFITYKQYIGHIMYIDTYIVHITYTDIHYIAYATHCRHLHI